MTGKNPAAVKILLTSSCVVFLNIQPSPAADIYKKMANDIAKYSAANKVKNIAVIGFERKAMTSREESEYVAEKLLICLVKSGKVSMMERSQLDKVMQEQKLVLSGLSDTAAASKAGLLRATDAIITGTVFGTKDQLKIMAKIIDSETGIVLHTIEAVTDRQRDMLPERPEFEFEMPDLTALARMFGDEAQLPSFNDFRDAPTSFPAVDCTVKWFRVAVLQNGAVEAKAKYWARKLRDPEFSSRTLTRNPGGEIKDPDVKKRFYELLEKFYKSGELPKMSLEELNSVKTVISEEKKISDECGML